MKTRRSARLLVVSNTNELLLFRYHDEHQAPFWATPGGELLTGESYADAAKRELREETGFDLPVGNSVRSREAVYSVAWSGPAKWLEEYFLVKAGDPEQPDQHQWTDEEQCTIKSCRWWSAADMRASSETFLPEWLPDVLEECSE